MDTSITNQSLWAALKRMARELDEGVNFIGAYLMNLAGLEPHNFIGS